MAHGADTLMLACSGQGPGSTRPTAVVVDVDLNTRTVRFDRITKLPLKITHVDDARITFGATVPPREDSKYPFVSVIDGDFDRINGDLNVKITFVSDPADSYSWWSLKCHPVQDF